MQYMSVQFCSKLCVVFFNQNSFEYFSAMGPKADAKAEAKAKPKTENRQGRALGSGTVSGARRARRLAQFGPPTGIPRNQVDAPALTKAFVIFVKYLFVFIICQIIIQSFIFSSYVKS